MLIFAKARVRAEICAGLKLILVLNIIWIPIFLFL